MKEFLKIGEFASMVNISTKTLRHYEKTGVFEPVYRDPLTGYRYYTREQLKEIYTLISLKRSGIALKDIKGSIIREDAVSLYREAAQKLEKEIERLTRLKEEMERRVKEIAGDADETLIEERYIPERRYYIHTFEPIDQADSTSLYEEAFKLEERVEKLGLPYIFRGALLSLEEMREGRYSCRALIYEIEDEGSLDDDLYTGKEGKYVCLRYRGDTRTGNKRAMKELMAYIEGKGLEAVGDVIGFARRGAHTASEPWDYYSEIQVRVVVKRNQILGPG